MNKVVKKVSLICIISILFSTLAPFALNNNYVYASSNVWSTWEKVVESGSPSYSLTELDTPVTKDKLLNIKLNSKDDKLLLTKEFPVDGGNLYVVDTFVKASVKKDSVFKSVVVPYSNGVALELEGETIEYLHHNNTRRDVFDENFTRVRVYFKAPDNADTIHVTHTVHNGPIELFVVESTLNTRPSWNDIIEDFSSSDITHPIQGDISKMFWSGQWNPIKNEKENVLLEKIEPILNMDEQALIENALENAKSRKTLDEHPEYEAMSRRLAILYDKNKDDDLARKAILIMLQFADTYDNVPKILDQNDLFHAHGRYISMDCLYGYDLIYNSKAWDILEEELDRPVREIVENWFLDSFMNLYNIHNDTYYSNITPYGIRNAMGVAVVLNKPDIIRLMIPWIDTLFSGKQFHADGMWQEGTISYGAQVTNNTNLALEFIAENYKDPEGYKDTKFNLKLDHTDLSSRWPLLEISDKLNRSYRFPNGTRIGLHDTWTQGQKANEKINEVTDPILPKFINNLELWHFGHFSLNHGDENDVTQVHLAFPPLAEGLPYTAGHYHGNHLGITLWGAGMEMLPDSGYPKGEHRYFNMDTQSHNTAWVWNKDASDYTARQSTFARPSLLAYDPGTRSDGAVQLVEASSPGPVGDLTDMKRRLLLMVQTEGNRSYVLDLQRLKGGQAHELFMHASEDEDSALDTSLEYTKYDGYTLDDYMKEIGKEEGLDKFRYMFKNPLVAEGSSDFNFTWTGEDSKSSIGVFMNGIENSEAIFTRASTNRRTQNKNKIIDDYPGWHFYRRNLVSEDDITKFGAVYETYRENQDPIVKNVTWTDPKHEDPMSIISIVDMGEYEDIVYISDDNKSRKFEDINFAGKVAILRRDSKTKEPIWAYVYGEGHVKYKSSMLKGEKDLNYNVTNTSGSLDGSIPNTITVDKKLPKDIDLNGVWLNVRFQDESGYGLRIEDTDNNTFTVHNTPGFKIDGNKAIMEFFPSLEKPENGFLKLHSGEQEYFSPRTIVGKTTLSVLQPSFKAFK